MGAYLSYHNFSIHGDDRWYRASRISKWAPIVTIWIFIFSVLEIVAGAIYLVQIANDMEISKVIHTLIIPGLSFFNAVPSLHLHMLLRKNPPRLSMWSCGLFASMFFIMAIILLVPCSLNPASVPLSLRQSLCANDRTGDVQGPDPRIWSTLVGFFLISFVLYSLHGFMASRVWKMIKREEAEKRQNPPDQPLSALSEEQIQRARALWRNQARYEF